MITEHKSKSADWITMNTGFYRDVLERKSYEFYGLSGGALTGLHLPQDALTRIYRDNAEAWLNGPPRGATQPPQDPPAPVAN